MTIITAFENYGRNSKLDMYNTMLMDTLKLLTRAINLVPTRTTETFSIVAKTSVITISILCAFKYCGRKKSIEKQNFGK